MSLTAETSTIMEKATQRFVPRRLKMTPASCLSTPSYSTLGFTTNIDLAEKGESPVATEIKMKRLSTSRSEPPPPPKAAGKEDNITTRGVASGAMILEETDITNVAFDETNLSAPTTPFETANGEPPRSEEEINREKDVGSKQTDDEKHGYNNIIEKDVDKHPFGWPMLAAFQNSGDSVAIYRRFGDTHARLLLHLEAEITALEEQLSETDRTDSKTKSMHYRLKRNEWKEGWDRSQKDLIDKLRITLLQYDELLLKDSQLRGLPTPHSQDYLSFFNWIWIRKPLDEGQYTFAFHRDDFVSSVNNPRTGFDRAIEWCLTRWPKWSPFQRIFGKKKTPVQSEKEENVHIFSSEKIAMWARIVVVGVAVTILLIPIFLLYFLKLSDIMSAVMVLLFVLSFATMMSIFTGGKVETVFVGTSTYCAVLVTFLGNVRGKD